MATIAKAMMPQGQRESCQSASVRTGSPFDLTYSSEARKCALANSMRKIFSV